MSQQRLTDRTFAPYVNDDSIIHIVNTGDTIQYSGGSSYKVSLDTLKPIFTAGTGTIVTGGTYANGTLTLSDSSGNNLSVTGFYTGGTDVRVTGGTYSNGTLSLTNNTGGTFSVSGFYTGGTDVRVTGATYNNSNTFTFTNNTGGTFNVSFDTVTGLTSTGTIASYGLSATTFNLVGSQIESTWTSYIPVWTASGSNPVIGNGTIEGWYKIIGKTCFVRGNIAMGSSTTFGTGEWYVSMPVTAVHADAILMTVTLLDNGSAWYNATMAGARAGFNNKAPMQYVNFTNGTASDVNSTQPFTWTTSDRFIWNGSYEIA
jgi:hypothetical protein